MRFAQPEWLVLLALVPILAIWEWRRARRKAGGLRYSSVTAIREVPKSLWVRLRVLPPVLRMLALTLGILALARPQERNQTQERFAEGVDIMLVLDTSTSMQAQDFYPNRFEAAREVATEFIRTRVSDRVGLIVFSGKAFTQVPLTIDYDFMLAMLDKVRMGMIEDGTAIGTAIGTAVSRLKDSEATSKVAIVLTDGQNNRGEMDPVTAAEIAKTLGIRIYTIGMGTQGHAPYLIDNPFVGRQIQMVPVIIDEEMLTEVATLTGGRYYRATDSEALRNVYAEISELEKTRIEELLYVNYTERYARFLWPAFGMILLEVLLSTTRLRKFP
jgi:Ca-activated chloride channel homolog